MCIVSFVGDHYNEKWQQPNYQDLFRNLSGITREEFEALKKEVLEMKELLKKAKIYDERNNEPDCEIEEKIKTLRKIAEAVGINLDDVLKGNK